MPKRVFIIHGWGGFPTEGWFPWLKKKLEADGYVVTIPAMPNPPHPKKEAWMPALAAVIENPDADTYLVGHSLGCEAILLYLQSLPADIVIRGVVLVAPVAGEESITNRINIVEGAWDVLGPWIRSEIDWNAIRSHAKKFVGIFSDNDMWIRPETADTFQQKLGAKTVLLHDHKHFSGDDGITELPDVYDAITSYV